MKKEKSIDELVIKKMSASRKYEWLFKRIGQANKKQEQKKTIKKTST